MENRERVTSPTAQVTDVASDRSYVDWAAIAGGAVVAVAIGLLSSGFGAALGLTAISAREGEGSGTLALALSGIWIAVSMVSAYATGGYVAGRMRRRVDGAATSEVTVRDGMNGLIVWGVGILLSAMVLGSAIGTTVAAVGNVASSVGQAAAVVAGSAVSGVASAAGDMVPDSVKADPMAFVTGGMLRPATITPETGNENAAADAASVLGNLATTGEISDQDRAYLIQLTTARTGLTEQDATARVDSAIQSTKETRDAAAKLASDAEQTARDAAEAARKSAILTAFLLTAMALVSAVAAYVAAIKGGRHRDDGRVFGGFAYRR
ncbi:MAG: hypothetical protein H7245_03285 [Candidatus Saccharibacteria bacterium]|nr:hypothetical protein [Pseudorhodobacter sp.]